MDIKINGAGSVKPAAFDPVRKTRGFSEILSGKIAEANRLAGSPVDPERELLDRSEKVLDLLDEYVRVLKNPQKSLREIEPLVSSIENEVEIASFKADGTVPRGGGVEQLVKELSVTASVAMLKFRRGDYI
jgi:hypothetical protein